MRPKDKADVTEERNVGAEASHGGILLTFMIDHDTSVETSIYHIPFAIIVRKAVKIHC